MLRRPLLDMQENLSIDAAPAHDSLACPLHWTGVDWMQLLLLHGLRLASFGNAV